MGFSCVAPGFTKFISFLIFFPIFSFVGIGQNANSEDGLKEIQAHPLNGIKIQLDGQVNEDFWINMPGNGGFLMQEPIEGNEPTEQTIIRVAFDEHNIYIAGVFYDSDP